MSVATQIAALETALATGAKSVTDEHGRKVEFAGPTEIIAAIASLKSSLQESSTGTGFAIQPLVTSGPRN